ncbi:FAD binding domain-containing protein [Xylariaceae sp. FL0016]|nr:FAD binding domain-containing protein [Xylariaceae sp. FL0016]
MTNVDVLVIGAGPTGMALALELAAQNVSFRIIDKATERSPYSRALAVQPRVLELLNRHGISRDLIASGTTADATKVCVNGTEYARIDSSSVHMPGTAFPSTMVISQVETEKHLETALAKRGVKIEMGVQVESITQDSEGVTVKMTSPNGVETVRVRYVAGADGAHSCVRHAAKNLTFEGEAYQQEFILADTHIKSQQPPNTAFMCLGKGVMVVLPIARDRVRLVVSRPGHGVIQEPELKDFEEFMQEVFPGGGSLYDPLWITRFHLHHRGVNNYRDGRLFVAGDAAHIHSPAGGQGMNTGISDSINLGWKLAAVLRGEKPNSFLDSYNNERHPVGEHLLKTSDKTFNYVASTNPIYLFFRNLILPWVLPWLTSSPQRVNTYMSTISQLRVRYRRSDIVGTASGFDGPVKGGWRAPDGKIKTPNGEKWLQELFSPGSHHVLLFSGVGSDSASEGDLHRAESSFLEMAKTAVKVHTIFGDEHSGHAGYVDVGALHQAYGFNKAGYVLVRPDIYIAHIGYLPSLSEAQEYL